MQIRQSGETVDAKKISDYNSHFRSQLCQRLSLIRDNCCVFGDLKPRCCERGHGFGVGAAS